MRLFDDGNIAETSIQGTQITHNREILESDDGPGAPASTPHFASGISENRLPAELGCRVGYIKRSVAPGLPILFEPRQDVGMPPSAFSPRLF